MRPRSHPSNPRIAPLDGDYGGHIGRVGDLTR